MSFLDSLGLIRDQVPQGAKASLPLAPPFATPQTPQKPDATSPTAGFIASAGLLARLPPSLALPVLAVTGVVKWFAHQGEKKEKKGPREISRGLSLAALERLCRANEALHEQRGSHSDLRVDERIKAAKSYADNKALLIAIRQMIEGGKADTLEGAIAAIPGEHLRLQQEFWKKPIVNPGEVVTLAREAHLVGINGGVLEVPAQGYPKSCRLVVGPKGGTIKTADGKAYRIMPNVNGHRIDLKGGVIDPSQLAQLKEGRDYLVDSSWGKSPIKSDTKKQDYLEGIKLKFEDPDLSALYQLETKAGLERMTTPADRQKQLLGLAKQLRHRNGSYAIAAEILTGILKEAAYKTTDPVANEAWEIYKSMTNAGGDWYRFSDTEKDGLVDFAFDTAVTMPLFMGASGAAKAALSGTKLATRLGVGVIGGEIGRQGVRKGIGEIVAREGVGGILRMGAADLAILSTSGAAGDIAVQTSKSGLLGSEFHLNQVGWGAMTYAGFHLSGASWAQVAARYEIGAAAIAKAMAQGNVKGAVGKWALNTAGTLGTQTVADTSVGYFHDDGTDSPLLKRLLTSFIKTGGMYWGGAVVSNAGKVTIPSAQGIGTFFGRLAVESPLTWMFLGAGGVGAGAYEAPYRQRRDAIPPPPPKGGVPFVTIPRHDGVPTGSEKTHSDVKVEPHQDVAGFLKGFNGGPSHEEAPTVRPPQPIKPVEMGSATEEAPPATVIPPAPPRPPRKLVLPLVRVDGLGGLMPAVRGKRTVGKSPPKRPTIVDVHGMGAHGIDCELHGNTLTVMVNTDSDIGRIFEVGDNGTRTVLKTPGGVTRVKIHITEGSLSGKTTKALVDRARALGVEIIEVVVEDQVKCSIRKTAKGDYYAFQEVVTAPDWQTQFNKAMKDPQAGVQGLGPDGTVLWEKRGNILAGKKEPLVKGLITCASEYPAGSRFEGMKSMLSKMEVRPEVVREVLVELAASDLSDASHGSVGPDRFRNLFAKGAQYSGAVSAAAQRGPHAGLVQSHQRWSNGITTGTDGWSQAIGTMKTWLTADKSHPSLLKDLFDQLYQDDPGSRSFEQNAFYLGRLFGEPSAKGEIKRALTDLNTLYASGGPRITVHGATFKTFLGEQDGGTAGEKLSLFEKIAFAKSCLGKDADYRFDLSVLPTARLLNGATPDLEMNVKKGGQSWRFIFEVKRLTLATGEAGTLPSDLARGYDRSYKENGVRPKLGEKIGHGLYQLGSYSDKRAGDIRVLEVWLDQEPSPTLKKEVEDFVKSKDPTIKVRFLTEGNGPAPDSFLSKFSLAS